MHYSLLDDVSVQATKQDLFMHVNLPSRYLGAKIKLGFTPVSSCQTKMRV